MGEEITSLGSIHICPRAIATIVHHAALQSYGVVGLAPKNLAEGIARTVAKEPMRGVSVHYDGENLTIDIFIYALTNHQQNIPYKIYSIDHQHICNY